MRWNRWIFGAMLALAVLVGASATGPSPDAMAGWQTIMVLLVGSIVTPVVTEVLKRLSWVDEELGAAINLGVCVVIYLVGWAVVGGHDPATMQSWLMWGLGTAGVGSAAVNVIKTRGGSPGNSIPPFAGALLVGLLALPIAFSSLSGCATALHPGAVNKFDSDSWDALLTAQTMLEQASADPTITGDPASKAVLNKAIAAYDTAESAWQLWHSSAVAAKAAGNAAAVGDSPQLSAQIAELVADVGQLRTLLKGGKP